MHELWEIRVPCNWNDGRPVRTRHHREWDRRVREITGGLTILKPGKGTWVNTSEVYDNKEARWVKATTVYSDRIIPVRLIASADQMRTVANITISHYEQLAVMYYRVSDCCVVQYASELQTDKFIRTDKELM